MIHRFYKDDTGWYIDLQSLIEDGTFSKANLAMVAGADTLLDILSNNGKELTVQFEDKKFKGWEYQLEGMGISKDEEYLESVGHPIEYGGDYICTNPPKNNFHHELWLCQVCSFLFGGEFPKYIYIKIIKT